MVTNETGGVCSMDYKKQYEEWLNSPYFDENTNIGRVCKADKKFIELKNNILMNFNNVRIVNNLDDEKIIKKIGNKKYFLLYEKISP